ncbi:MAG: flippase [Chitinispirillaceae bacterium]
MIDEGSRLIRNSFVNLFNKFFTISTSWIISIWVARQLGPTHYGIFTLILWFNGIFTWVIGMGLTHAVTKYIAEYKGRDEQQVLGSIVWFVLKIELTFSAIVTLLLIVFRSHVADYFFSPSESFYFLIAFLGIVPGIITAIFSSAVEGIQKFEYFAYANLIFTPLSFLSKVVVLWMGLGIEGILIVMVVFSFVNTFFYISVLRKEGILARPAAPLGKNIKKRICKYNASVLAIILCDKIIWDKSENFFLGRLCNASQIAFYNLGFNIANKFTSILPSTLWRVLFPAMSSYFGSGDQLRMKRLFYLAIRYIAFVSFPVGVGGAILAYPIIHHLYGHEFIGAQRALQILFLTSIITSLSNPGSAILYGYERQSVIYKIGIALAALNICLDILLIRSHGATGAAIAYSVTTLLGAIIGTTYTCKLMKLQFPFVFIFKVVLSTVLMGSVMRIITVYNHEISGLFAAIAAGAITYLVSSLCLVSVEMEDYQLLKSIEAILPGKCKKIISVPIRLLAQCKNEPAPINKLHPGLIPKNPDRTT